uniref:hypothetical protein n=1 Tax=Pannonibacter phragmitetus TaxID=121719 RepID=UPI000B975408|nr:hypothetical protein [Pannonibacter phragmitetus]
MRRQPSHAFLSFVMVGLVPAICQPLTCTDPRHKAEDDGGEAAGVPETKMPALCAGIWVLPGGRARGSIILINLLDRAS